MRHVLFASALAALALSCAAHVAHALPLLSIADTTTVEGDAGAHPIVFTVRLSEPASSPVSFHVETFDGTATVADGDYDALSTDVGIPTGDSLALVEVTVHGDSLLEGNERFTLRLTDLVEAEAGDTTAVGSILNDERTHFTRLETGIPDFCPGTIGPAWGAANDDSLPDLPMYTNVYGLFTETPGFRDVLGDGNYHGGAWCDYDRDGRMELVLMPYGEGEAREDSIRVLKRIDSEFVDVADSSGILAAGCGETPVWADFDADGWPDLFAPFYSHVPPWKSSFFLNRHDGTFEEHADSSGVALAGLPIEARPEGATAADVNGDGAIDLYCASHLFLNDGDAHFTDVRAQVGLPEVFDEGAQFVDYDDDGDLDLYLRTGNGPTLERNDGGTFTDVSPTLGIGVLDWGWGGRWCDVDVDGDLDLVFFDPADGPRLLLANGDGSFAEDTTFTDLNLGAALSAFADFEGDGDPDVVVGDYYKHFARNRLEMAPRAHTPFLKVRVEDAEGRLVEHGSLVRLRALDDPKHPVQTRIVDGGSGYLAQDEYTITFGGVGSGAFDLEVAFPSKPGSPVVVGPAQNPLLAGLRPGDSPPQCIVVRADGSVTAETIVQPTAGVRDFPAPAQALAAPAPNPARRATRLDFSLGKGARATLAIFDVAGRRVRTLMDERREPGAIRATWDLRGDDGAPLRAGLYFARLTLDGRAAGTRRVVVTR